MSLRILDVRICALLLHPPSAPGHLHLDTTSYPHALDIPIRLDSSVLQPYLKLFVAPVALYNSILAGDIPLHYTCPPASSTMQISATLAHLVALLGWNNALPDIAQHRPSHHSPHQLRGQACNGQAAFCDRLYSNVSWIGTHDSAFVGSLIDPRVNQEEAVASQLNAGIRFLQAQTHLLGNSTLELCHTSCIELDAGRLETYLATVKTWLDANPNEVLTMLLVNGDDVDVSMFGDVLSAAGLSDYAFVPSTSPNKLDMGSWPTYGELIESGKRLVMFLDAGADESTVPYVLDEVCNAHFPSQRSKD